MKQISNLEPLKRTRSIHSTRPSANAKTVLVLTTELVFRGPWLVLQNSNATENWQSNALFELSWKLDAIPSKPWMPASQMMGFKRRREPFVMGRPFLMMRPWRPHWEAVRPHQGGRSVTIRKWRLLLCTVHFCFRLPPPSYCPLWETLPQRYRSCRMIRIAFPPQFWYMCNLLPIPLNSMDFWIRLLFPLSLKDPLLFAEMFDTF